MRPKERRECHSACKIGSRLRGTSLAKFAWPRLEYILIDIQLISNHDHEPAFAARFYRIGQGKVAALAGARRTH